MVIEGREEKEREKERDSHHIVLLARFRGRKRWIELVGFLEKKEIICGK